MQAYLVLYSPKIENQKLVLKTSVYFLKCHTYNFYENVNKCRYESIKQSVEYLNCT